MAGGETASHDLSILKSPFIISPKLFSSFSLFLPDIAILTIILFVL
jgi:hypothetical protein